MTKEELNTVEKESFESAMSQLEEIVQQLERGSLPLDQSIKMFKKGIELSQYCQKELDQAEEMVTKVMTESGLKKLDEEPLS
ncbi:exodeoxyribonuclease VII small subunit [Facklamia languida]|uniref:Exodeoxyribonuclease 7 small subunit n=1 Tax=Facklamia languida CCUG 37842 TaxID=883113 RepID=H3NHT8_9LACT|nr:exodeoxyribonuclease VII small subunit [Facklamia languida]EHR37737.1 exodeoxyribonuclease VII, small subunit [Facklamia languida CCUG 37842]